ncbi:MAG: hypothetical protein FJ311_10385 [Rhodospirillales bacterium]|nr:hypothetical protein [Rhodospirillales bacterium]
MSECQLAERQFKLAWEHFKFHAEQRTKMFNFFLLAVALLLNAFSSILDPKSAPYNNYAFIVLSIGGFLSTMFFALDIRNTQLIKHSEDLLRKIENNLYPASEWKESIDGKTVRLGLLSREEVLGTYIKNNIKENLFWIWINVDNIKHKLSIRLIVIVSMLAFWVTAIVMTCGKPLWFWVNIVLFLICSGWTIWAMLSPARDLKREQEAWGKAVQDAEAAKFETRKTESAMAKATVEAEGR